MAKKRKDSDSTPATRAGGSSYVSTLRRGLPRPKRPRPVVLIVGALSALFGLGGVYTLALALASGDPTETLVPAAVPSPNDTTTTVSARVLDVDASAGLVRVRLAIRPQRSLLSGEVLSENLDLVVNDTEGSTVRTISAGQPVSPIVVSLPLSDGVVAQYPFDTYSAILLVRLTRVDQTSGTEPDVVPISMDVSSTVSEFDLEGRLSSSTPTEGAEVAVVEFEVTRSAAAVVYTLGVMAIMLALAVTGIAIIWATYNWRVELPPWIYGYFVGVLFALPPLRASLPGAPPPGAIVDFLSFYPSVGVVASAMVVVVVHWLRSARLAQDLE